MQTGSRGEWAKSNRLNTLLSPHMKSVNEVSGEKNNLCFNSWIQIESVNPEINLRLKHKRKPLGFVFS